MNTVVHDKQSEMEMIKLAFKTALVTAPDNISFGPSEKVYYHNHAK